MNIIVVCNGKTVYVYDKDLKNADKNFNRQFS